MLLAVAAAEVGLRLVGWSKPHLYRPDPHRGWALSPGARGLYTDEGRGWIEVNRFGFRGPAPTVGKPEGTFRIALLGDSQAEALQVDLEDSFGEVLERRLDGCSRLADADSAANAPRVEVLNFGVSGYGTAQSLLTLRHAAAAFDPDLVLLAVYTGNDVRNNVEVLERDPLRPYFVVGGGGGGGGRARLALDDSFRDEPAFRRRSGWLGRAAYGLLDASRLAQVGKAVWAGVRDRRAAAEAERRRAGEAGIAAEAVAELGLDNAVYRPPDDAAWRRAWRVTEALVLALDREAAAAGADFALVTLSNGIQVHPDRATREAFAARLGVADLTYPDRRLAAFARRHGIPALPLVFPLARLAEERGLYLHGFAEPPADAAPGELARFNEGHWNRHGHRAAGELLARWLCSQARRSNRVSG